MIGKFSEQVKSFEASDSSKSRIIFSLLIVTLVPLNVTLPPFAFSSLIVNVFICRGFRESSPPCGTSFILLPFP